MNISCVAAISLAFEVATIECNSALVLRDEIDADLLPVFLEEGRDLISQIESAMRSWQKTIFNSDFENPDIHSTNPFPMANAQAILCYLHTIKGSVPLAETMVSGQQLHEMEGHIVAMLHSITP
ncbi:MAG: hypothetical protein H7240_13345 [Glaciimonas sp.]|nr:hypothetical protein [Glaciimonas sp.]